MKRRIFRLLADERGATAIEYALIASLIAVAAITAMRSLGNELETTFSTVEAKVNGSNEKLVNGG
ncbi:Flp family type IVb pilin [Altererythrobacter epoxidivorans]|nr:Flp family type IVb pilin [Altererythrobacter epoxidivorans]